MKRVLITAFHISLLAIGWMILSWLFVNSPAIGAQAQNSPAVAAPAGTAHDDVSADMCHGKCGHHHHGHFDRLFKKLGLTDAQRAQVKQVVSEERANMKPLVQSLREARKELRELTKNGAFDEQKVRASASKQADTMVNLIVAKERMKSRIYALLTPEQRAKAEQLKETWKHNRKEKKQ